MGESTCLQTEVQTVKELPAFSVGLLPLAEGSLPSSDSLLASLVAVAVLI